MCFSYHRSDGRQLTARLTRAALGVYAIEPALGFGQRGGRDEVELVPTRRTGRLAGTAQPNGQSGAHSRRAVPQVSLLTRLGPRLLGSGRGRNLNLNVIAALDLLELFDGLSLNDA